MPTPKEWTRLLEPYMHPNDRIAVRELVVTLVLYSATWVTMCLMVSARNFVALPPLYILQSGFAMRLFIVQHDCGHGSYFSSRKWNDRVGAMIGVLTLTPYAYWKKTHAIHHATSGNLDKRSFGDIRTLTIDEYLALGTWGRFYYRTYRHPLVFLTIGPVWQFVIKHRLPFDIPWSWKREWRSVIFTNIAIVLLACAGAAAVGWRTLLLVQVPVSILAGVIGVWLFFVQHQFQPGYWRRQDEWDFYDAGLLGSSHYELHPVLQWFSGNIGFHPLHHVAPRIPNYKLPACHEAVPEAHVAVRLKFFESLHCSRLALWDERRKCLVGFDELEVTD